MAKRTFDGEFISDIARPDVVVREICGNSRWSIDYYLVFRHEGKLYSTTYERGATECQEVDWPESFECEEVEPYQELVTKYRPVAQ